MVRLRSIVTDPFFGDLADGDEDEDNMWWHIFGQLLSPWTPGFHIMHPVDYEEGQPIPLNEEILLQVADSESPKLYLFKLLCMSRALVSFRVGGWWTLLYSAGRSLC